MTAWLVDTNVVSELSKPRPDPKVIAWLKRQPIETLYLSTVTIAEIRFGIERLNDPIKRNRIGRWLEETLRPRFENRIIAVGENELLTWRFLSYDLNKRGRTVPQPDLLIAAIALTHRLGIATRDVEHFLDAQVPVFNPWTGEQLGG